jgi:phytoene dehydrogenase-like protein
MPIIFGRDYPTNYDAIIIGSGIGGLFCGNILAKAGLKVLLLERHYMLGGFCSTFRRRGFIFDAATHFYPLLGNPTTLTGKLLQDLEIPTEWIKMDPVDQFHLPSMPSFSVPADFGEYLDKLKKFFPAETTGIDAYFAELRQAYLYGLLLYFRGVDNERARQFEQFSLTDKLNQHFHDARLKALLMADTPHWGSLPDKTSYLFDAMLRLAYFLGNYYPKGSSQKFADDLGRASCRAAATFSSAHRRTESSSRTARPKACGSPPCPNELPNITNSVRRSSSLTPTRCTLTKL